MAESPAKLAELLAALAEHEVDFVIVGGTAAVLGGAPVVTFDLDIVHDRSSANVARLAGALSDLEAYSRTRPDRRLAPNASHLEGEGHVLLNTRLGPLDVLCTVGDSRAYHDLIDDCYRVEIGKHQFQVLGLRALIELKEHANREKDRAALPTLRAALRELDDK